MIYKAETKTFSIGFVERYESLKNKNYARRKKRFC